jgi:phosphinothricin acetyltransferase
VAEMTIRLAGPDDGETVAAIYEPHVRAAATSFELEPPTAGVMRARIAAYLEHAPWLVCERGGQVAGYAYASKHRERLAYQWDVEVSVYVHEQARRLGVGRGLYASLFKLLVLQGFCNAYAGITLPNRESVALHESMGFTHVGVYSGAGYKLGAWHDVGWWQIALQPRADNPVAPRPLAEATRAPEWNVAMRAGEVFLRR